MNIFPMSNFLKKSNQKIYTRDLALLFRQLATLISAGIPIAQCCDILVYHLEKIKLQKIVYSLKRTLESGKTLATGLRQQENFFDEISCHLIETGEQTGTLDNMLSRVAMHYETRLAFHTKIKNILFYPGIVLFTSIVICLVMLLFVIPRFDELFQQMNKPLPTFTLGILYLSHCLRTYYLFFLLILAAVILFYSFFKKHIKMPFNFEKIIFHLPLLAHLQQKIILARFTRSFAITIAAGIPISEALRLISKSTRNSYYTKSLLNLQREVNLGHQLYVSMHKNSVFPKMMVQMIKVGEESGSLARMLERIADTYESELDQLLTHFGNLLEPLIMSVLGVLIGALVIAMYLPIFKLGAIL